MSTPLLIGLTLLLLVLTGFWAMARTRRIRAAALEREEAALARVRAGGAPLVLEGETVFDAAGLPSRMPERRGIEVSEHDEVVDLEALLAGEPQGVANRARATLEEPTNISLGLDTLPPRPAVQSPAPMAAAVPQPSAPVKPAVAPRMQAAPPTPQAPVPSRPAPQPVAAAASAGPAARPPAGRPQPSPPTLVARLPHEAERLMSAPAAAPIVPRPAASPAQAPAGGGATIRRGNDDVPLRELALAWFEARGYRSAPASSAVRPIEQVLRHRHDPARAYAFVVENARVTPERVQALRAQARAIGLLRVLIVANEGADEGAVTKSKGVRVMDRASLATEFDQLDFSVAAKIIAVARKRAGVPTTVH